MIEFFIQQGLFILTLGATLFLPGVFFLRALFPRNAFAALEYFILSVPLSFALVTISMLIGSYAGIMLSYTGVLLILALLYAFIAFVAASKKYILTRTTSSQSHSLHLFSFAPRYQVALVLVIVLMFVIKVSYFTNTIFPTATDLGHHMFWVNKIVQTQSLSPYKKISVIPEDTAKPDTSVAHFTEPEHIPDFIVGEHLIFVPIAHLSGQSVVSAFPSLVLLIVHFSTIFLVFIFALRLLERLSYGKNAALWALIFIGPLYAISSAQAKFVSGGVIGNIIGNALILAVLYFLYRALREKNRTHFFIVVLLMITLIFTHHLSTFVLGYVLIATIVVFTILSFAKIKKYFLEWLSLFASWSLWVVLIATILFAIFIHTPSYLNTEAISSSVGAPTKSTRVGIPFEEFLYMSGEARFTFGLVGLMLLFGSVVFSRIASQKKRAQSYMPHPYAQAFLIGWCGVLCVMTLEPSLLKVNILSTRIATYAIFPLAILAGYFLAVLTHRVSTQKSALPQFLIYAVIGITTLFPFINGIIDSNTSLKKSPTTEEAVETFHAAEYLAVHLPHDQWALKDHNYIVSDTWMKVFLTRDYANPLSRSYFRRYETQPTRERCTREMISHPSSDMATQCYAALAIGPVVVKSAEDASQFKKMPNVFVKVYENNDLSIFWHK